MQASEEIESRDKDASGNVGSKLQRAREAQDLSLDAVSAELRIEVPMLQALEEERFDALGAPVFAKGFLKQYGARLGLDTDELVAMYESASGENQVDIAPSKTIRLRDDRQVTFWVVAGIALVIVAATLAVWWWLGSDAADNLISDTAVPVTIPTESELGLEPEPEPDLVGTDERVAAPVPADAEPAIQPVSEPEASEDATALAPATPEPTNVADAPEEAVIDVEPQPALAAEAAFSGPQLLIVFNEDSWTEVYDESGEQLFYALGRAGTTALIPADRRLNLFFGNAAGIELSFGGEPVEIPASARRGDLAQFDFDPEAGQAQ
jgi:cytoskeleton protein RodZ